MSFLRRFGLPLSLPLPSHSFVLVLHLKSLYHCSTESVQCRLLTRRVHESSPPPTPFRLYLTLAFTIRSSLAFRTPVSCLQRLVFYQRT
jgi:hypothetical protein